MVDVTVVGAVVDGAVSGAGKLVLSLFLMLLVWFIITILIMLVLARKNSKRGMVVSVFAVSTIIMLAGLLLAYFKIEWFLKILNIGGI
jgi:hypothetical protein